MREHTETVIQAIGGWFARREARVPREMRPRRARSTFVAVRVEQSAGRFAH